VYGTSARLPISAARAQPSTEVLAVAADALRADGHVVFTLERAPDGETNDGYRLELHGRYSHDPRYVEQLLGAGGPAGEDGLCRSTH
jgi:hypothetical protein